MRLLGNGFRINHWRTFGFAGGPELPPNSNSAQRGAGLGFGKFAGLADPVSAIAWPTVAAGARAVNWRRRALRPTWTRMSAPARHLLGTLRRGRWRACGGGARATIYT